MRSNAGLGRRLARLEKASSVGQASVLDTAQTQALQVISEGDLQLLRESVERGASFSESTPEEQAAWERYQAEYDRARRSIGPGLTARAVGMSRPHHRRRGYSAIW